MKCFCNIGIASIAKMLGVRLEGRYASISPVRPDEIKHYLSAQIKLFFLLHFYANSTTGITEELSIDEIAKKIGCTKKTVYRSLRLLSEDGFLCVEQPDDGYAVIEILKLSDMYKKRGEGGAGYITCNSDELELLLSISSVRTLRVILAALIELASKMAKSASKVIRDIRLKIGTLMACFPKSARPCDVRHACSEAGAFGAFFNRIGTDTRNSISVQLNPLYDAIEVKRAVRLQAKQAIFTEIDSINNALRAVNLDICEDQCIHASNITPLMRHGIDIFDHVNLTHQDKQLPLLDIPSAVKNDMITIAQDYGIDTVLKALHVFYTKYLLPGSFNQNQKKSLGGLFRRIVAELFGIQANMI